MATLLNTLKRLFITARRIGTCWLPRESQVHVSGLRQHELNLVLNLLPASGRLLELGAGTGFQASLFERQGYRVSGIDIPDSNYKAQRLWPVTDYDGHTIPFPDHSFDIVFSSNVLEHIPHVRAFQQEIHRVLKPDGIALHVLPSSTWRFWTTFTHLPRYWTPPRAHGEHAGNVLTELYYFSRAWWHRLFRDTGWEVIHQGHNGLFYTGCSLLGKRLSLARRQTLSRYLGASCNLFVLRQGQQDGASIPPALS